MLKTLRITSLIATVVAIAGVVVILLYALKGNSEIREFLASPGIIESIEGQNKSQETKTSKVPPLVAQAKKFALRIDPPPPPPPPKPKTQPKTPAKVARTEPKKPAIPTPKVKTSAKFDVLATVVYKETPEKSLALLKTTGNKQEWFRQGEKAGHLEIQEVRNGSVVFTQGGRNPQERFVPAKKEPKSLLKNSSETSKSALTGGPSSITVQLTPPGQPKPSENSQATSAQQAQPARTAAGAQATDSGTVRMVRPIDRSSRTRLSTSERIQRVRSIPKPPPPEEQKASIENTMSSIEEIMSRQDESAPEEQRQREAELWGRLLEELNTEKQKLEETITEEESAEKTQDEEKPEEPSNKNENKTPDQQDSEKSASKSPDQPK